MMDFASWTNILLFPVCALAAALVAFLVQLRAEARWRAEARSQSAHTPAD
jgi:hypothetical protein